MLSPLTTLNLFIHQFPTIHVEETLVSSMHSTHVPVSPSPTKTVTTTPPCQPSHTRSHVQLFPVLHHLLHRGPAAIFQPRRAHNHQQAPLPSLLLLRARTSTKSKSPTLTSHQPHHLMSPWSGTEVTSILALSVTTPTFSTPTVAHSRDTYKRPIVLEAPSAAIAHF
jgi:hypothetical protein